MKKNHLILSALFLVSCINVTGCKNTGNSTSQQEYEDYYTIDVSSISNEVLKGSIIDINPSFKNLGDEANPNFSVIITCDGEDVTDEVNHQPEKVSDILRKMKLRVRGQQA